MFLRTHLNRVPESLQQHNSKGTKFSRGKTIIKTSLSKLGFKKIKKYGAPHNQTFPLPCLLLAEIGWDHEILANFSPPQVPGVIHFQSNAHFRAADGGGDRKQRYE